MTKKEYLIKNIDRLAFEICENCFDCGKCPLDYLDCCINSPLSIKSVNKELDKEVGND